MNIPMVNLRPMLTATESAGRANLDALAASGHYILGEQVTAFEREFAAAMGAKYAVGVGSGTDAIELALRAAGVNGEVIVPALTSPYTAQAVLAAGCKPRFADVDPETLLLNADITKRTAAVVPVSLYGQPCAAKYRGVSVVQDACQAHGAPLRFTHPAAYSFYPTKNLPCLGDGGAVVTDSKSVAARVRLLRDGGRKNDQVSRIPAVNSRLDEMQACYLRAFLPKLPEWNAMRVRLAGLYDQALAGCDGVQTLKRVPGSVCHLYVVRARRRDRLRRYLAEHGIATGVHYPVPLHRQPAFLQKIDLPIAERACKEIVSLPLWPYMPDSAVDEVATRIREFYS